MKLTNGTLAALLTNLLTNPASGEIDDQTQFEAFCTDLAQVVCDYCGGEVTAPAVYDFKAPDASDWATHYVLEVELNESSPEGGGIWNRTSTMQTLRGYFGHEGTILQAEFQVPVGATTAQKDAAFMAALAQQADIDYHAVGESNDTLPDGDFGLTAEQLEGKHGQEHPSYTREDWRNDVSQGDTKLGYWEWVLHNVESHYHDPCDECGNSGCNKIYVDDVGYVCSQCRVELCLSEPAEADVAEWVGLHYKVNFDAESADRKADWRQRYIDAHASDNDADPDALDRAMDARNARRTIFVEAMGAAFISTSVSPKDIRIRRDLVAQEILGTYPSDTIITRELYDADGVFGGSLIQMNSMFEFPNWEGRMVGEFLVKHNIPRREPACMNVIQFSTQQPNKDGICASNITLQELWDAQPLGETGWLLPSGLEIWFHGKNAS